MAENLGSIRYDVEVNTVNMLKAESVVNKSIATQVAAFDKADKAVKTFENTQKNLGRTITSSGQVFNANGKVIESATNRYRTLAGTVKSEMASAMSSVVSSNQKSSTSFDLLKKNIESIANNSIAKLDNSFDQMQSRAVSSAPKISKVSKAVSDAGKSAGKSSFQMTNLSYQIQDVAVQAQMGTSAAIIFAQQFPQMMVGMGAAAGAIGAVVAILGGLITAMTNTQTTAQKLEKAIEQVKAVMTIGANGLINYTDELRELNKVSEQLAKIKLAEAILSQNEIVKNSAKAIIESAEKTSKAYKSTFEEIRSLTESVANDIGGNMDDVAEAISGKSLKLGSSASYLTTDLDRIAKKFEITRVEALDLGLAMSDVIKKGDAGSIKSLQNVTEDLASTYGYSNEKLTKLTSGMVSHFVASKQATDGANGLKLALNGNGEAIENSNEKVSAARGSIAEMTLALVEQIVALKDGERAALSFRLQMQGADEASKEQILALYDKKMAIEADAEATKKATEDNEAYKKSIDDVNDSLDTFFDKESSDSTKKDDQRKATLTTQVQSVGLTDEEEIKERYKRELELLKEAEEEGIEIRGTYKERREQLALEEAEALKNIHTENNMFLEEAFGNLDTQIAGTMAQVVVGAKDGKEAMSALANTILTQVIGAVVQWGIAEVTKLFTVETAEKGIQAANAAATTASVSAQVAMNTALAAQNAFMATAAIPLVGPVLAPAAAAAAGAASAAIGASAIPLAPLAGAREFGGPVSSGSMYRVGEKGKPEFYKDNLGNLSMIPGENGEVIPASKMGGSGGGMTVNISNNTPYEVFVTQDQATSIANVQIGKEAGKLQKGRGSMYNAMKSGGNYSNNAKR